MERVDVVVDGVAVIVDAAAAVVAREVVVGCTCRTWRSWMMGRRKRMCKAASEIGSVAGSVVEGVFAGVGGVGDVAAAAAAAAAWRRSAERRRRRRYRAAIAAVELGGAVALESMGCIRK